MGELGFCYASLATLHLTNSSMPDPFDILASSGQFQTTPGLLDNVVYDVIPLVPGAVGNVTVNASIWNVECSDVPEMWFQPISEATMSYPVRFKNWTSMDVNTPGEYPTCSELIEAM